MLKIYRCVTTAIMAESIKKIEKGFATQLPPGVQVAVRLKAIGEEKEVLQKMKLPIELSTLPQALQRIGKILIRLFYTPV